MLRISDAQRADSSILFTLGAHHPLPPTISRANARALERRFVDKYHHQLKRDTHVLVTFFSDVPQIEVLHTPTKPDVKETMTVQQTRWTVPSPTYRYETQMGLRRGPLAEEPRPSDFLAQTCYPFVAACTSRS